MGRAPCSGQGTKYSVCADSVHEIKTGLPSDLGAFHSGVAYSPLLPAPYWEPALVFRCCPAVQGLTQGGVSKGDGATLHIGWPREGLCHARVDAGADKTLLFLTDCAGRVRCWLLGGMRDAVGHGICQEAEPGRARGRATISQVILVVLHQCLRLRSHAPSLL